jgi:hypothetical protein
MGESNPAKNSLNLMGESNPAKKQPQSYGAIPQQGTLAKLLSDFVG